MTYGLKAGLLIKLAPSGGTDILWKRGYNMLACTYIEKGKFQLVEKPKPVLQNDRDAIVRVTLGKMCIRDRTKRV